MVATGNSPLRFASGQSGAKRSEELQETSSRNAGETMAASQLRSEIFILYLKNLYFNPIIRSEYRDEPFFAQILFDQFDSIYKYFQIREAAQALLLAELGRLGPKGRKKLVEDWSQYLPKYATLDTQQQMQGSHQQNLQQHNSHADQGNHVQDEEEEEEEEVAEGESCCPSTSNNWTEFA